MKKMFIMLVISLTIIGSFAGLGKAAPAEEPIPEPIGPVMYDNELKFCYFANTGDWWTGLAILNKSGASNTIRVAVYDETGTEAGSGVHTVDGGGLLVDTLPRLIETGEVPTRGSILIQGTSSFMVDKFTGNHASGGFSEIEKSSEGMILL